MAYITSTMTAPVAYTIYTKLAGGAKKAVKEIRVKGGANAADKRTLLTPAGVATQVSEEELEALKAHPVFKKHLERGFVAIVDTKWREEAEKAAKDLQEKDGSAPKTPADYKKKGKKAPKVKK